MEAIALRLEAIAISFDGKAAFKMFVSALPTVGTLHSRAQQLLPGSNVEVKQVAPWKTICLYKKGSGDHTKASHKVLQDHRKFVERLWMFQRLPIS